MNMRLIVRWLLIVAAVIGFAIAAGVLLGGVVPVVAIIGNFAWYAVWMCLAAAVLAWRMGERKVALAAGAALALNAAFAIPAILPNFDVHAPGQKPLRLMLHNIWWNNAELDKVVEQIRAADADVVVLQEVYNVNRDQLRVLDAEYPYRVECWASRFCDVLILSRVALEDGANFNKFGEVRLGLARAGFSVNGCPVTLFAAHLNRPWPYTRRDQRRTQANQVEVLAEEVRAWPGPKIVAGDFNATPWTHPVTAIEDAAKGRALGGFSGTWPWFLPGPLKLPIDHVIVSRPVLTATRTVLEPQGSDHSAVLVELTAECRR